MSDKQGFKTPKTIKMTTTMEVPISLGTMEYAAGIDPVETWQTVTRDETDSDILATIRQKHAEIIRTQEETSEFQEKLKNVAEESIALYQGIMNMKADIVKPYVTGRTFNFILGMPRTGGTTLYQALSDAYGWPWERLLLSMTHNFMPNGKYCVTNPASEFDMGWRLPWNFNSFIFELCQFLVYINNEAPDSEHVFIKSTAMSYAVKMLNYMFEKKANYIITVRHPGAIVMSSGKEEIKREDHIHNLALWANLYSSIIRDCRPLGRVSVVEYGQGLTDTINAAFAQTKAGTRLEDTAFFEYEDYDKEFYESDGAKSLMEFVKTSWGLFDLEFPIPEKCI